MKPKPTAMDKLLATVDKATNYSWDKAHQMEIIRPALKHLKIKM